MRRMTRNKGRTDSKAEEGRKERTIETQLQRRREAKEDKATIFLIDFLLVLVIFCHYVTDRKLCVFVCACRIKLFYVT